MRRVPSSDQKRLQILNESSVGRLWNSCDEQRHCIFCERVFTGREVRVSWFRRGVVRLHCPTRGCRAGPLAWVHAGNPLLSKDAWEDWERIIRESDVPETPR